MPLIKYLMTAALTIVRLESTEVRSEEVKALATSFLVRIPPLGTTDTLKGNLLKLKAGRTRITYSSPYFY